MKAKGDKLAVRFIIVMGFLGMLGEVNMAFPICKSWTLVHGTYAVRDVGKWSKVIHPVSLTTNEL